MPPEAVRRGWWRELALEGLARARQTASPTDRPQARLVYALAVALIEGWKLPDGTPNPEVLAILDGAWDDRYTDTNGRLLGWGLGYAWDAFNDGTTNPADTSYAITTSGHVGGVMVEAYSAGVFPLLRIAEIVDCILNWPSSSDGRGPAYSRAAADIAKPVVWNIGAAHASLLRTCRGVVDTARQARIDTTAGAWLNQLKAAYQPALSGGGGWPYQAGGTTRQDGGHNALCSRAAYQWTSLGLDPVIKQLNYGPGTWGELDFMSVVGSLVSITALAPANVNWYPGRYAAAMHDPAFWDDPSNCAAMACNAARIHVAWGGTF